MPFKLQVLEFCASCFHALCALYIVARPLAYPLISFSCDILASSDLTVDSSVEGGDQSQKLDSESECFLLWNRAMQQPPRLEAEAL